MKFEILSLALAAALVNGQALPGTWPAPDVAPTTAPPGTNVNIAGAQLAPVVEACPKIGEWAVTYDDGPSLETRRVLQFLRDNGDIKATFFVVGSRVIQNPDVLREVYRAGHQIALHSWSHADLATLTPEGILADLSWNIKAVKDAIGVSPRFFRAPLGSTNDNVRRVAGALGLTLVNWNRDTNDWRMATNQVTRDQILANVTAWARDRSSGVIMLQHDLFANTVDLVPTILSTIRSQNNNIMPLGQCLGDNRWYSDANPVEPAENRQPPAATQAPKPTGNAQNSGISTMGSIGLSLAASGLAFMYFMF